MKHRFRRGMVAVTAVAMAFGTLTIAQEGGAAVEVTRSTSEGVYTAEQAQRGRMPYMQQCSACHGDDLVAVDAYAPDLTGPVFANRWVGSTVGERYVRIRDTMPLGRGGTLDDQTYADILAFVFSQNRIPAGDVELPADEEALLAILIEAP